jgi:hypothetical protein
MIVIVNKRKVNILFEVINCGRLDNLYKIFISVEDLNCRVNRLENIFELSFIKCLYMHEIYLYVRMKYLSSLQFKLLYINIIIYMI